MHYRLATATLLALLALIADATPPQAQSFPPQGPSPLTQPFPMQGPAPSVQPGLETRPTKSVVIRTKARERRRAVRPPPPNLRKVAERKGFKRVSDLVNFPKFFPSLGIIFVKPDTLPLGPFLCFDRKDRLMATVYMVPMKDFNDHKSFEAPAFAGPTDHVSIYHNPGHAGVDMPHYHVVIWHVTQKEEARVAK